MLQAIAGYRELVQALRSIRDLLQPIANLAGIASHAELLQAIASQPQTNGNLLRAIARCSELSPNVTGYRKLSQAVAN